MPLGQAKAPPPPAATQPLTVTSDSKRAQQGSRTLPFPQRVMVCFLYPTTVWWQMAACHKERAEMSRVTTSSSHGRGPLPSGCVCESLHPQFSSKSESSIWTGWQMLEVIQLP